MKIKVGYQGIKYANNYFAVKAMVEKNFPNDEVELVPLEKSANVVKALKEGTIDYGSCAFHTDLSGAVEETKQAVSGFDYEVVDTYTIDVHHYICKRSADVKDSDIRFVVAHPEALKECSIKVKELFPEAVPIPYSNSATCARDLSRGLFTASCTAVICDVKAAEEYGLAVLQPDAENIKPNGTDFCMIKAASK